MINKTTALQMPDGNKYGFYGEIFYGVCDSGISDHQRYVSIDGFTRDNLVVGTHVFIKFNAEPMGYIQLNINRTGFKNVRVSDLSLNTQDFATWKAGQIVELVYNGTCWIMLNAPDIWYGKCTTTSNVSDKLCLVSGFENNLLKLGTILIVEFEEENTSTDVVHLVINSDSTHKYRVTPCIIHRGFNVFILVSSYYDITAMNNAQWCPIEVQLSDVIGYSQQSSNIGASQKALYNVYNAVNFKTSIATLTTAGWSSKTQTVSVAGVTSSNIVIVSPAPTSHVAYCEAGIYCSAQGANTLTFTCDEVPESALTVNILYK